MTKDERATAVSGRRTWGQVSRWGALSAFSFCANLGLTVFFKEIVGFPPPAAFASAVALVLVSNFLALRYFVFQIDHVPAGRQALRFAGLTLGFRITEWIVFSTIHYLFEPDYRLLVVCVLSVSSAVKFFTYRGVLSR
jgi:hypothetical protein